MKENEVFIEIPESMIFSFGKIENSIPDVLKKTVFLECPLFENMSVRLAIALMVEKMNASSKFKPYFDVLPDKFRTVLYFSPNEMKELQATSAFTPAVKQVRFIATQYAFLYKYLMISTEKNDPVLEDLRENFTFEFYRWAVSCIMTRQNLIPRDNGERESVLIPAWDMANHANGPINTQYNDEARQIESFCLKDFSAGEQVTIAYGNRSNIDFLIHNGFVFKENENRHLTIPFHLNKTDELHDDRAKLLEKVDLSESGSFQISPSCSPELLAFVRVFNMSKEQLTQWLEADNAKDLLKIDLELDKVFQRKVCQSLLIRVKIILKLFPTNLTDDQQSLESGGLSKTKAMLVQYRVMEKKILNEVAASLEEEIKLLNAQ
jgi:histone-lysine N-methyltransferase SETD3